MNDKVLLQVQNLEVAFRGRKGEVPAIRKISFDLYEGEIFGIVGESGSGKSVSTHCILKLLPSNGVINGGKIIFEGKDLLAISPQEMIQIRGNEISMIFQDPMTSLDPLFTIGYQLEEVLKKHTKMSHTERKSRSVELLQLVGINQPEKRISQYPHEFSGGMRQRVMIAMALACKPKLLIADEPTTALDVTIQAQIVDLLKELAKKMSMSVIFITHDLGVVADICDRISVMYAGEIVESGKKRQIFYQHQHPYTEGLLYSVPSITADRDQELIPIEGNPPDMSVLQDECPFARRCGYAMKICAKQNPPQLEAEEGHYVSCWKYYLEKGREMDHDR